MEKKYIVKNKILADIVVAFDNEKDALEYARTYTESFILVMYNDYCDEKASEISTTKIYNTRLAKRYDILYN